MNKKEMVEILNRKKMKKEFENWTDMMRKIMLIKNKDYGMVKDPLANLRSVENVGITMDHGIVIRMMDKMSRLCSFYEKGYFAVKDETINDTLIDICNYAFLHYLARKETEKKTGCKNEKCQDTSKTKVQKEIDKKSESGGNGVGS